MPYGGGFRRGFRRFNGPRQMTKIKCSECGKEDEVPFKPREGTPVYCKDCFFKKKGITPRDKKETSEEVVENPEESESEEEQAED
jgi:CxxC-x17-CxxC domain-containing protein